MTQPEKIEHILNGGCEYFGVIREQLIENRGPKSKIWHKKIYLVMLLREYTICNNAEIADCVGYKRPENVLYHIRKMKDELSEDVYGSNKTKMIYSELLKHLEL